MTNKIRKGNELSTVSQIREGRGITSSSLELTERFSFLKRVFTNGSTVLLALIRVLASYITGKKKDFFDFQSTTCV